MSKNKSEQETEHAEEVVAPPAPDTSEPSAPQDVAPQEPAKPSEAEVLKDRLLRLQADFDNFRKRTVREKAEWQSFATEQFIRDLLPVVDHFELGLATAAKQADSAVLNGLKLVYDQLLGVLKKQGVTPVSVAPGATFNPHEHEAITQLPSEEHEADMVIAETRKGYKLGDKLIRPLQVVVSSGPGAAKTEGEG